ncbi:MAG: peptidyl-prolyl cis-trans isomerase [Bacteroidales bacterium]|nr:peptidyl-prolyl cis-trans isomerase [Bacteroidales bacterium]
MRKWLIILLTLCPAVFWQCGQGSDELLRGKLVAKVGEHRLYQSQLQSYIPVGVSPEDSAALATRYINAWAEDLLLLDMAEEQLSEADKNVNEELEEYRKTLLKYRYRQLYVLQRLDTLITEEEVEAYYNANKDRFRLDRPVIKARYMIIPENSRSLESLKKKMSSNDEMEVTEADSLARYATLKYVDASDTWMDAITLGQEVGTEWQSLLKSINKHFAEVPDEAGNLHVAYIVEMVQEGKPAPQEYVRERIRELILSNRKHKLESDLERDLLEDARRTQKFVIF